MRQRKNTDTSVCCCDSSLTVFIDEGTSLDTFLAIFQLTNHVWGTITYFRFVQYFWTSLSHLYFILSFFVDAGNWGSKVCFFFSFTNYLSEHVMCECPSPLSLSSYMGSIVGSILAATSDFFVVVAVVVRRVIQGPFPPSERLNRNSGEVQSL